MTLDLKELLANVQPNLITPHLKDLATVKNDRKPRTLAHLMVKQLHASLDHPVPKQLYHQGKVHTIRYFDITPLLRGVWSQMSLMLLQLSYAEQCDIIDALYPEDVKLTAKAFAINFTKDHSNQQVVPVQDVDVSSRLDATNVGIAMILTTLTSMGGRPNGHPDLLLKFIDNMQLVADEAKERQQYKKQISASDQANHHRDHESKTP